MVTETLQKTRTETAPAAALSPMTGKPARFLFRHDVLGKYPADYFYDETIGSIFVRDPHWLEEAYSEAISSLDTGVLVRNLGNIELIKRCLAQNRAHSVISGVDLGAGYGLFVRGMRDAGIDFRWSDKYAENLLARGFEAKPGDYSIAVAFEVLEHLPNPIEFLQAARRQFRFQTCFFSAACFDEAKLPNTDWWYFAFEGGQHITFFSRRALEWMARQLQMRLWHIGGEVFAFSNLEWEPLADSLPARLWRRARDRIDRMLLPERVVSRESLTWNDHLTLRDGRRGKSST